MKSLVIVVLLASFAFAQPVTSPVPRPQGLTLPHRTLSATLTLEAGLNKE